MTDITLKDLLKLINKCDSYHGLHEEIAHKQGKITRTDEARHTQNLYRASLMRAEKGSKPKITYQPNKYKASRIEDEFEEFRQKDEMVVIK